jgi:hypothetical protein
MHNLRKDVVVEPIKWGKKMFQSQALPQIWDENNLMFHSKYTYIPPNLSIQTNKSKVGLFT